MSATWNDRKTSRGTRGVDREAAAVPTTASLPSSPGPLDPSGPDIDVDELLAGVTAAADTGTNADYIRAHRRCYDVGVPKHLIQRAYRKGADRRLRRLYG